MLKYFQTRSQLFYKIFSLMQAVSLFCVVITTFGTSTHFGYILFGNTKEKSSTTLLILTSISLSMILVSSLGQIFSGVINGSYDKDGTIILSGALSLSLGLTGFAKVDITANVGFLNEVRVMDIIRGSVSIALFLAQPFLAFKLKK